MKKQFKLLFMGLVAVSGSHAKDINVAGVEVKPSLEITSGVFYSQQTYHHPMQIKGIFNLRAYNHFLSIHRCFNSS